MKAIVAQSATPVAQCALGKLKPSGLLTPGVRLGRGALDESA